MRLYVGRAVLFLHAFPVSSELYTEQFKVLEEEGIPYVALDYPGFGGEPPLPGDLTLERLTDWVVSRLTALGVREVIPVGDSMGGYIIFDMVRRYRDLIRAAVFVATRAEADTEEAKLQRYKTIERVKAEGTGFLIDLMLENQSSPATKRDEGKMRRLRCMMERATPEGVRKTLKALAERRDNTDLLGSIDFPVLVVAGKDDRNVTPPSVVRRIAEGIRGSRYLELENSAHLPPFENPDAFNRALLEFLREVL
jgi:pimeloyl-ACP methyl ester carboxylesterase